MAKFLKMFLKEVPYAHQAAFDQKHSKDINIVKHFKITVFYFTIFKM